MNEIISGVVSGKAVPPAAATGAAATADATLKADAAFDAPRRAEPTRDTPMPVWKTTLGRKMLTVAALLCLTRWLGASGVTTEEPVALAQAARSLKLPASVSAWTGQPAKIDEAVFRELTPDAATQSLYTLHGGDHPASRPPQVASLVVYSRHSKGLHSPAQCFGTEGWTITNETKRTITRGAESITFNVLTREGKLGRSHLAYIFADTQMNIASGWLPVVARLAGAKLLHRNAGAVVVQFGYDAGTLQPNGEYIPEFADLVFGVTKSVRRALAFKNER